MQAAERWLHEPNWKTGASTTSKKTGNSAIDRGNKYHQHVYSVLRLNELHGEREGWELLIEPWFRNLKWNMRQPDAIYLNRGLGMALVVEVKMNWADGRDLKLVNTYLPIVKTAFELNHTYPLVITGNIRGLRHPPLLTLQDALRKPLKWKPGQATPTLLLVKRV